MREYFKYNKKDIFDNVKSIFVSDNEIPMDEFLNSKVANNKINSSTKIKVIFIDGKSGHFNMNIGQFPYCCGIKELGGFSVLCDTGKEKIFESCVSLYLNHVFSNLKTGIISINLISKNNNACKMLHEIFLRNNYKYLHEFTNPNTSNIIYTFMFGGNSKNSNIKTELTYDITQELDKHKK